MAEFSTFGLLGFFPTGGSGMARDSNQTSAIVPSPRIAGVSVRTATMDDAGFIEQLQKMHTHMVGWFPRAQMQKYIGGEHVVLAENDEGDPLGYCIFKDQYMKRDDVGIIYQLNVLPLKQRNLIGATLVKESFERAAYGCRLFSCWCAQDIAANWFWESIGFVPLAFRTGSRGKQRIHIYWQRRIRAGDDRTPLWFPYETRAGAMREDRIVLPIPSGTHWRDVMPLVLPGQEDPHPGTIRQGEGELPKTLPGGAPVKARPEQPKLTAAQRATIKRAQSAHLQGVPVGKKAVVTGSGIKYVDRTDYVPELDDPDELREAAEKKAKKKRSTGPRAKHDPKLVKQARELRDRYLEAVNERGLLPEAWTDGKYDVSRALERDEGIRVRPEDARLLGVA